MWENNINASIKLIVLIVLLINGKYNFIKLAVMYD